MSIHQIWPFDRRGASMLLKAFGITFIPTVVTAVLGESILMGEGATTGSVVDQLIQTSPIGAAMLAVVYFFLQYLSKRDKEMLDVIREWKADQAETRKVMKSSVEATAANTESQHVTRELMGEVKELVNTIRPTRP